MFNEKGEMRGWFLLGNMHFDPDPNNWNAKILFYTLSNFNSGSKAEGEEGAVHWKQGKVRYFHYFVFDVF